MFSIIVHFFQVKVGALLTVIGDSAKLRICPQVLEGGQSDIMLQTVRYLRVA